MTDRPDNTFLNLALRNPYDSTYSFVTKDYDDKINRIKMPYDTSRQLYLEYDGFSPSNQNEETFVRFLFPKSLKRVQKVFQGFKELLFSRSPF